MKTYIWSALTTLLFSVSGTAQEQAEVIKLVGDGILFYQEGMYDDAQSLYQKALEVDPKSSLALYEMALLYYDQMDYKRAIEYVDLALKFDKSSQKQAFLLKGSALDNLGDRQGAIKIYKKAIKRYADDYLVHYNIGLTYWRAGEVERAEDHLHEAVFLKPDHLNSHYLIYYIQNAQGKVLESLLSGLYYLSLDPESQRATELLEELLPTYSANVRTGEGNVINISLSDLQETDHWTAMRVLIPMLAATKKQLEAEAGQAMTDGEAFEYYTASFIEALPRESHFDGTIWSEIYLPFFQRLQYHDLIEPFVFYAAMSKPEWSGEWLEKHPQQIELLYSKILEADPKN